jgi:hypothetical protein
MSDPVTTVQVAEIPKDPALAFGSELVPLNVLLEVFRKHKQFPYNATFSVDPCIDIHHEFLNQERLDALRAEPGDDTVDDSAFQSLLKRIMPDIFYEDKQATVSRPFSMDSLYSTPSFEKQFDENEWAIKLDPTTNFARARCKDIVGAGQIILDQLYDKQIRLPYRHVITMVHIPTGLERYYELNMNSRFIKAKANGPLKPISDNTILELLKRTEDADFWLSVFPPEQFEFSGFHVINKVDITDEEVVSRLKTKFLIETKNEVNPLAAKEYSQTMLRSYLGIPDLGVGISGFAPVSGDVVPERNMSIVNDLGVDLQALVDEEKIDEPYRRVIESGEPVVITDLKPLEKKSASAKALLDANIRSLILMPAHDEQGQIDGLMEFTCKIPQGLNSIQLQKLNEISYLFELGNQRFNREIRNRTTEFIQRQFTSIHPSVAWKFNEVAMQHEINVGKPGYDGQIPPIVFEHLYPLYGQADIVGSSSLRNEAIREDLIHNLRLVEHLAMSWLKRKPHLLLEMFLNKVQAQLQKLEEGFISSDESSTIDFIKREIHPLLDRLADTDSKYKIRELEKYYGRLDETLGILYEARKAYEQSVNLLNKGVGEYLEQEDEKLQEELPHYFEKYKTDGVEYNMYFGKSILRKGDFSEVELRNMRLWQLQTMIGMTKKSQELAISLPVPLETAQLIFVYGDVLDIRFREDEKQFDVDGAYNVRYEILKKRIDKATVKGSNERLTLAGKIAIVYLQDRDKREYMEYLKFFVEKGLLEDDIEDIELNPLQGAEGLRALRVTPV